MSGKSLLLLLCVLVLFILGLSMVFNTTSAEVLDRALAKSTHHAVIRQLLYAILAGILAAGVWFLGFDQILRLSGFFLGFVTFLLVLVFIPGIGQCLNGAHRWLGIGSYSFQPSELAKYLIPLYYISYITSTRPKWSQNLALDKASASDLQQVQPLRKQAMFKNMADGRSCEDEDAGVVQSQILRPFQSKTALVLKDFLKLLLKLAVPMGLILIEPDNGTVAIILSSLLVLFLLTKIRWVYWGLPLLVIFGTGVAVASQMPHVHNRIQIYLHPELDLQGKGHQPHQAKIAAGSGGVLGRGLGESLQKLNYLPEARSDYIAAIFAEEFGFVGICGLVVLYTLIGYLGFSIAAKTDNLPAFYTVAVFTFLICFQAFLNLGVVSGLLPSKGTNLPFFSHGSSSLLANLIVICIILNIANKKTNYVTT